MTVRERDEGRTAPDVVAVVGSGDADAALCERAEAVGRGLAEGGAAVVTGGLGGVMAAAARGAAQVGGLVVGLLPGVDPAAGNPWLTIALTTGLGEGRNLLVVRAARVVVAVGGGYGTLSEIALALRAGTPVVGLETWQIPGVQRVPDAPAAVERALAALRDTHGPG